MSEKREPWRPPLTEPTVSDYPTQAEIDEIHDPFGLRNAVAPQLPPLTEPTHGEYNGWCRVEGIPLKATDCLKCLRAENERLRAALTDVQEIHQPMWVSESAKAAGKEPWVCHLCGAADGGWPCDTRITVDEALAGGPR